MKKHRMTQLSRAVRRPEFKAVFESPAAKTSGGNVLHPHTRVQCAEVQHTTLRAWWRLVGRRHDVQWWLPDVSRSPALPVPKHPSGNFAYGTANMPEKVAWVARTFEPVRRLFFNDASFELCGPPLPNSADRGQWAVLSGSVANTTRASWEAMRAAKKDAGVHDAAEAADCGRTLKEVVVFREPAVVHVYNVVEYGRRFFRTLVPPTRPSASTAHAAPRRIHCGPIPGQDACGERRAVPRHAQPHEGDRPQTFVPGRLLAGSCIGAPRESTSGNGTGPGGIGAAKRLPAASGASRVERRLDRRRGRRRWQ